MALTSHCIEQMYVGEKPNRPVVQLISLKHALSVDKNAPKRVKCNLSDGSHFGAGVLTAEVAAQVINEKIRTNAIVRLTNYTMNTMMGTRLCLILGAEIVEEEHAEKIGEPVQWENGKAPAQVPEFDPSASPVAKEPQPKSPLTAHVHSRTAGNYSASPPQADPRANVPLVSGRAMPITALNPYSNRWLIKVRVTSKGDLRTFETKTGAMQVFHMDLCDESGEIRATAWREAAEKFFPLIEVGKVYLVARGQLKLANKKFSTLNNAYEISLNFDSQIEVCDDEVVMPKIHYSFVSISEIESKPANAIVDIVGIVNSISQTTRLTSKAGKELVKRTLNVADDSGKSIELTLWGAQAENFPEDNQQVVAFKGLRVTEWNQRSLSASMGSSYEVHPEHDATERLKAWWADGGAGNVQSISVDTRGSAGGASQDGGARLDLQEMQQAAEMLSESDTKGEFFTVRSYVSRINPREESPMWYSSCPKCNKKVASDGTSICTCEACGWSGDECSYRYMLALVAVDASGSQWLTAFNEQATALLGKTAPELKRIKEQSQHEFEEIIAKATWQPLTMRLRAKKESYNNVARTKVHVVAPMKTNFVAESKLMLADIAKYDLESPSTA
ncbi:hypothetical protein AB1Y20_001798 [Prymnesium parvum]|uniref:Replication protein A subunit n=1 Tax=Prymnesium parvum TaxID=97485 RepID=A0AB34KC85_PRYPA